MDASLNSILLIAVPTLIVCVLYIVVQEFFDEMEGHPILPVIWGVMTYLLPPYVAYKLGALALPFWLGFLLLVALCAVWIWLGRWLFPKSTVFTDNNENGR